MAIRTISVTIKNEWVQKPPKQQAGGRNYIKNGNFLSGLDFWGKFRDVTTEIIYNKSFLPSNSVSCLKMTTNQNYAGVYQLFKDVLKLNKPYTLSFLAKKHSDNEVNIRIGYESKKAEISLSSEWKKYTYTFTPTANSNFVVYSASDEQQIFYITNIQLETGEKASDYTQYPFIEEAIQGSTDVNGGLLLGNVLGVKDKVGKVRAYMSGIKDTLTAFAAGVSNFGTSSEKRKIDIRHDGSAKIGVFDVDADTGDVSIFDKYVNGLKRLLFRQNNIPKLEPLLQSTTETGSVECPLIKTEEESFDKFMYLGDSIELSQDNIDFKVVAQLKYKIKNKLYEGHYFASFDLYKFNENTNQYELYKNFFTINKTDSFEDNPTDVMYADALIESGEIKDAPAGKYRLGVRIGGFNSLLLELEPISLSYVANPTIRRIEFGRDGFMAFYSYDAQKNFIRITENDGVQIGGQTNIPGILASGSSSKYGMLDRTFGKIDGVEKTTDGYRIYHNIGHGEFSVQITPHLLGSGQRNNDGFNIKAVDHNVVDIVGYGGFDFALIGKNYV